MNALAAAPTLSRALVAPRLASRASVRRAVARAERSDAAAYLVVDVILCHLLVEERARDVEAEFLVRLDDELAVRHRARQVREVLVLVAREDHQLRKEDQLLQCSLQPIGVLCILRYLFH